MLEISQGLCNLFLLAWEWDVEPGERWLSNQCSILRQGQDINNELGKCISGITRETVPALRAAQVC